MKYCFKYFNTIFLIVLIHFQCLLSLRSSEKNQNTRFNVADNRNLTSTENSSNPANENMCDVFEDDKDKDLIIKKSIQESKTNNDYPNKFYFLFFVNRNDNFIEMKHLANNLNIFFHDLIKINFYCSNKTISNKLDLSSSSKDKFDRKVQYAIHHGEIIETKTIEYLSEEYLNYLLERFNLTSFLNDKVNQIKNQNKLIINQIQLFIQNSKDSKHKSTSSVPQLNSNIAYTLQIEMKENTQNFAQVNLRSSSIKHVNVKSKDYFIFVDEATNRLSRFMWSMLLVIITSSSCFLLVKFSVDWATASQTELNKIKANQFDHVARQVKYEYTYIINRKL